MRRPAPVFLARRGYRLRRLRDAARLLPVAGAFLLSLPLLWGGGSTGGGILFIFGVWAALILAAALLSRPLAAPGDDLPGDLSGDAPGGTGRRRGGPGQGGGDGVV